MVCPSKDGHDHTSTNWVLCRLSLLMQPISWVEQGLTSHQTHYRSYRGRVFTGQMTQPMCQRTEGSLVLRIRLQSHQVHPTVLIILVNIYSMKQKHTDKHKYMHSEVGPVWQTRIQRTVRTSHICVLIIVHNCHTQYSTKQFWLFSLLTSRQASYFRYCLFMQPMMPPPPSMYNCHVFLHKI